MHILDLPDELLLLICNQLNHLDLLYSLVDVNQRFNRLTLNSFYTRHLDFTTNFILIHQSDEFDQYMNRICENILPRIHHQVNKLTLRHIAMAHLHHTSTFNFPHLHSLSLVLTRTETFVEYLTADTLFRRLLHNQIKCFSLNINLNGTELLELEPNLFVYLLSLVKHVTDFTLIQRLAQFEPMVTLNLRTTTTSCMSSILTKLDIDVATMDDCLYLLDERFKCLSTLIVRINRILPHESSPSTKQLPNLKCFSLISLFSTYFYDNEIVPLLRRMSHLEQLTLYLRLLRPNLPYIDGHHLSNEIFIHMPRLNKFTFSIYTLALNFDNNLTHLSNDDIQRSFVGQLYPSIGSCIDANSIKNHVRCHIYSLPYHFGTFYDLNNFFQGGIICAKVHWLIMSDKRPFEHEFFQLISQCFPGLRRLSVKNNEQQISKQHSSTFIEFPHLTSLELALADSDYAEQFLLKRKTCVPCLAHLSIKYESLVILTNHFTKDTADLNCAGLNSLSIKEPFVRPENFHVYFPRL